MDKELLNITSEFEDLSKKKEELKRRGGFLGRTMKWLVPTIMIFIAAVVIFFPWHKVEYTILNKKTILCYNPISKICVTMELEKETDTRDGVQVEYYEVKTKGSGYVNIFYSRYDDKSGTTFYVDYGNSSISIDKSVIKEYETDEISSFKVVTNYMFGYLGDEFLQKAVE